MISERGLDGHDRDAATWFKRANTKDPENGGAKKTSTLSSREWLEETRERWADRANEALERAGRPERINEASLKDQYFEAAENGDEREMARLQGREPGVHIGPHNIRRFLRGEQSDRLEEAMDAQDRNRIRVVEAELTRVEQQIRELKEIYDRARAAIDKRLEQVGRAIRAGADAVVHQVKDLSEHVRGLEQRVSGLAEQYEQEQMRLSDQVKSLSEHVRGLPANSGRI